MLCNGFEESRPEPADFFSLSLPFSFFFQDPGAFRGVSLGLGTERLETGVWRSDDRECFWIRRETATSAFHLSRASESDSRYDRGNFTKRT